MRQIFLLVLVISPGLLLAQNSQELDNRNGFQDIELLTDISTKVELEHWKPQKDKPRHDLYRPAKGAYESIGNVRIYKLIEFFKSKFISSEGSFGQLTTRTAFPQEKPSISHARPRNGP